MIRCRLCGHVFPDFNHLLLHIERECPNISGTRCPVCGREHKTESDMKKHLARKSMLYDSDPEHRRHFEFVAEPVLQD